MSLERVGTCFQAANVPAMLSTLLEWRPGSVRSGTTPAPQPPPGAAVALRLPKVFRGDVSAAQLVGRNDRRFRPARDSRAPATQRTLKRYALTAMSGIKDDINGPETKWIVQECPAR